MPITLSAISRLWVDYGWWMWDTGGGKTAKRMGLVLIPHPTSHVRCQASTGPHFYVTLACPEAMLRREEGRIAAGYAFRTPQTDREQSLTPTPNPATTPAPTPVPPPPPT